jgi:GNAT superfamily N-acetyltransferase
MNKQECLIRKATNTDVITLLTVGDKYFKEVKRYNGMPLNKDRVAKYALLAIQDPSQEIFVAVINNRPVGFMWVGIVGQIWTEEPMAKDLFLYVLSEYRGRSIAKKLIIAFEEWAVSRGVRNFHTGANSGIYDDYAATQLYVKQGYSHGGRNFYKHIKEEE